MELWTQSYVFFPRPQLESEQQKYIQMNGEKVSRLVLYSAKVRSLQFFSILYYEIDEIIEHLFLPRPQYGIITFKSFKRSLS